MCKIPSRRCYQRGCRGPACTDANTQYLRRYRSAIKAGRPVLGAHVANTEAARVIAALLAEGFRKAQIAAWLGYVKRELRLRARVTVRTTLRLRVIQRRICG